MARPKKGAEKAPEPKKNFTVWTDQATAERIQRAVTATQQRTGYPVSVSAWLLAQVVRGLEEEEKRGKGGGR